jgi:hypothetical protein
MNGAPALSGKRGFECGGSKRRLEARATERPRSWAKGTWAKDLWHLCSRVLRKILSHTIAAWINVSLGHRPLHFASLLSE